MINIVGWTIVAAGIAANVIAWRRAIKEIVCYRQTKESIENYFNRFM